MATKATTKMQKTAYTTVDTHDIAGTALDWAVAAARKLLDPAAPEQLPASGVVYDHTGAASPATFSPTTNYAQLGPLMDEEGSRPSVTLTEPAGTQPCGDSTMLCSTSRLTAACRCIVLKHFGERVRVPNALLAGAPR